MLADVIIVMRRSIDGSCFAKHQLTRARLFESMCRMSSREQGRIRFSSSIEMKK
jgi:hypothetical protein